MLDSVSANDFDALIIPGGYAPDKLRKVPKAIELTRQFHEQKKLVAYICHVGWIPVSANIVRGIRCTYASIEDDMVNAGANWVDEPVSSIEISSRDAFRMICLNFAPPSSPF